MTGQRLAPDSDTVLTPDCVAEYMVKYFRPTGKVLDPCSGEGVFLKYIPDAFSCEISEGRDFYDWNEPVDYLFGNPPYSIFSDFLRHSFKVASHIVYLIPANKIFNSYRMMQDIRVWGGVKEIHVIAPGSRLKFPIGFCIAAVHFVKDYRGDTAITYANLSNIYAEATQ